MKIIDSILANMMCIEAETTLAINEKSLILSDEEKDNRAVMSPISQMDDIRKANNRILLYIDSIKDKQRTITPAQISIELGMSKEFVETILLANGFQEDY